MKSKVFGIIENYINDLGYRAETILLGGLIFTGVYGIFEAVSGIILGSVWLIIKAGYYILLGIMRYNLVRGSHTLSEEQKWRKYRNTAWLLLAFTLAERIIGLLTILGIYTTKYPGYLIYGVAVYILFLVVNGIRNILRYRKMNNPVYSASKAVNSAAAVVAFYSLQVALLGYRNVGFVVRTTLNTISASIITIYILGMAIYMLNRSGKNLKRIEAEKQLLLEQSAE